MGPALDEVVERGARAGRGAHVAVPLEGVGVGDLVVVQPALDQLAHRAQRRLLGQLAAEVADDADGCTQAAGCVGGSVTTRTMPAGGGR